MNSRGKELADRCGDFRNMRFQREVSGVEEADDRFRNIAFEGLGARRQEEGIILSPHREEGWLVGAEVLLEGRIERDVALVVADRAGIRPRQAASGRNCRAS